VLVAAAVCCGPLLAQPLTVYDTFGPGDAYDHNSGTQMAGPTAPYGLFASGFLFTPTATVCLDTIQLPIGSGNGPFRLSVQLADRGNGMPGTLLETFPGLAGAGQILTVDSVSRPALQTGLFYWLVGVGEGSSTCVWQCNSLGLRGSFYTVQGGREAVLPDQVIAAFRITGTVVPEPSGIAFFLLGALALALAARNRSRKPVVEQERRI